MKTLHKYIVPILLVTIVIYLFDQGRMWLFGNMQFSSIQAELEKFSLYLMYSSVLGFANFSVVGLLEKKYPWGEFPKKRAIYGVIGAVVVSMISIIFLRLVTVLLIYQKDWEHFVTHESKFVYLYSLFITLVVVLIFYVINFYKAFTKKAITEHKVIAETEIAKYESLKNQLDPHFLFNSLNVLTSLIDENPKQAESFTTKLSKVYRYVLDQKEKVLVPLQEELSFAREYMDLLKMRFEKAIEFEVPEEVMNQDFKVVPLALQLLLENAIKHNRMSENDPLRIKISISNGEMIVSNTYNAKELINKRSGIGLNNINERYALITNKQVSIEKTKEHFSVKIPLLTKITNSMKTNKYNEEDRYIRVKERVEKMKEFYTNLVSYLAVNTFLIFLNYYTGWDHKWFVYPLIGWGIGLLFHYFEAFGYNPFLGKNWEEKKINEIMQEEEKEIWE